jgi:iron complex outermembrane receptor protein
VYTQLDGKFGPLNTSLGFRYQTVKIDTLDWESRPVFRAGLNYKVAEGTNLRASFGQAFRVPTVAERFANTAGGAILIEPNPTIGSEYGYSVEIGGRQGYRLDNGNLKWEGYLDVAAFQMDYQNMVEFGIRDVSIGFAAGAPRIEAKFTSVNVARARIRGLEFTTINNWSWGEGWQASLSGGLTLTDPVNLNAVPDSQQLDLSGYPNNILRLLDDINDPNIVDQPAVLKYRQRVLVRTSATIGYGRVSLTTNLRYRSFTESIDQFLYAVVPDLGYFRETYDRGDFDATFIGAFDLSDQSTLSVTVDNAFNNEYLIIPGLLAPQRRATLQYLVRF